jgi:hypothetical protein
MSSRASGRVALAVARQGSLRPGRAPFNASGSSIEQRPCVKRPGSAPPAHDTLYGTRSPHRLGRPGRYYGRASYQDSAGAAPRALPLVSDLLCPPSRLAVGPHPPTPGGSQPAFARGDVASRLNPYPAATGRRSLPPWSFTRRPIDSPYGSSTLTGGRRAYHVASPESSWVRPRLYAGGAPAAPDELGASGPGHVPFWSKPVSIFGLSSITALVAVHLGWPYHAPLVSDRLDAGSRDLGSRSDRHPYG